MGWRADGADSLLGPGSTVRLLLGLWWPEGRWYRLRGLLLACLSQGGTLWLLSSATLKLYMERPEDLEELTVCTFDASICLGFLIKNTLFIMEGATLRQIIKRLSVIRSNYGQGEVNESIRKRYLQLSERMSLFLQVMLVSAVTGWMCAPMVTSLIKSSARDSIQQQRQFALPMWGTRNIYTSPTYEILYFLQAVCTLTSAEAISTDILFFHMMLMVTAELEILNNSILDMNVCQIETSEANERPLLARRQINFENAVAFGSGSSTRNEQMISIHDSYEEAYHKLSNNIGHHQSVLRCVILLQSAMSVSVYIFLTINMASLCFVMFLNVEILQQESGIGKILKTVLLMPVLLFQTSMYCIFGQMITDQSEKLMSASFASGWPDCDSRFKRSLRLFMLATSRPLIIRVGKTCDLSKNLLVQVLNGTYGLLNLMLHFMRTK